MTDVDATAPRSRGTALPRRLDIQGLRALAVALVVADHLTGRPVGGFLGVDMFFVVSGFLITSLLLNEAEHGGRIRLGAFYLRRARRILPAALLVLAATLLASRLVLLPGRFDDIAVDAAWALGFALNWHEAATGTDYFASGLPPSPLQHYWSLGVEEQFYLVWPLLLIAGLALARAIRTSRVTGTGRPSARRTTALLAGTVLLGSLAWSWAEAAASPATAYFSTLSRAWELAAGALLACLAPRLRGLPRAGREALAALGLMGVVAAAVSVDAAAGLPAPGALVAVAATVAVLVSGIGGDDLRTASVLRLRPVTYLGEISFALYLWHFAVIVLAQALAPDWGPGTRAAALGTALALAVLTHHLVEEPLRRPVNAPRRRRAWGPRPALAMIGVTATALLVAVLVPAPGPVAGPPVAIPAPTAGAEAGREPPTAAESLRAELSAALAATEFPALTPPLDDVVEQGINPELEPEAGCLNPADLTDASRCRHGSGRRQALVVGDSVAIAWLPALREALGPDWTVRGYALSNCPFAEVAVAVVEDPAGSQRCNEARDVLREQVRAARPDLLVASDSELNIRRMADAPADLVGAWRAAVVRTVDAVAAPSTEVVLLAPPPAGHTPDGCITRFAEPADCAGSLSPAWAEKASAERAAASQTGATYVDTSGWFCVDGRCPLFAGGTLVRWDIVHLTRQYAAKLAPVLAEALAPVLDTAPDTGGPPPAG
ncbi:acyltransferase [Nocardioides sp. zg-536]|uniref:Acyltransferase n=1 Tax=Nocardioides faecalis TaxID=2803858 RepID=A0A938Y417_9ACTN|nr:acyltransferase family protein [Nocardioides faecalis]MBM9461491.1 acyltransferase [Nocardioides faecalis]QVI59322.1 acyltransferase [Nocardioides faecalis]